MRKQKRKIRLTALKGKRKKEIANFAFVAVYANKLIIIFFFLLSPTHRLPFLHHHQQQQHYFYLINKTH